MTRGRAALPPIDQDLAQTARPRLDLRALRQPPQADDAVIDANSRTLGARWGASTSLAASGAASGAAPGEAPPAPPASLRLEIPVYLDQALTLKAAQERVTKSFLVMTALAQAGYPIEATDLVPDRRKARGRKPSS